MIVKIVLTLCVLHLALAHKSSVSSEDPVVTTGLGLIKGKVMESRLGEQFMGFRGIRYAEPPVGELRFQPPKPVKPWRTVFDATEDGPRCPQLSDNRTDVSEDCLRINVYTKEIATSLKNCTEMKPVILYIHPGGYYGLSGQSKFFGPQTLMDRDVVLVTINYRLGTLGFMSTGTKESPGNNGMKDQVMAMKWIRDHIDKFGGDPNSVTILGYSAGAWSATLHMISPMSSGLFHKVIVMSCASTYHYVIPTHQLELAKRQARLMNCTDVEDTKKIVDCLKEVDAVDMGFTLPQMFEWGGTYGHPSLLWSPVIEPNFGQERFLTEDPTVMFQSGRFQRVPVITGITQDEFAGYAVQIIRNDNFLMDMEVNFTRLAPICFLYERGTERSFEISRTLKDIYLNGSILNNNQTLEGLSNLFSDSLIGFAVHRFMKLASRYTTVYYYKNSYVGRYSHLYYPGTKPYGAAHHDDLQYLFEISYLGPRIKRNDPENETINRMTTLWSAFATTGNPNHSEDQRVLPTRWKPVRANTHNYLNIGNELRLEVGLFKERFAVWDNLFPIQYPNEKRNN